MRRTLGEDMRPKPLVGLIAISGLALALTGLTYLPTADAQNYRMLALGSFAVSMMCFAAIYISWGRDLLRGPVLFFTLFLLFHLGLIWTLGLGGEVPVFAVSPTADLWVRTPFLGQAVWLSCLGAVVYTAVCVAMRPQGSSETTGSLTADESGPRLGAVGIIMELSGLGVLVATLMSSGGLALLTGGYVQFLESAQSAGVAYSIWLIGTGACLSQVGTRKIRRIGLSSFATYAVIFFPLGLRGSVLFPLLVLLAIRAMTGRRLRAIYLAVGAVGALALASVVRLSRVGLETNQDSSWYSSALSTISELGFSLRPTVEALRWEASGMSHTMFVSFFAVPIRTVEKVIGWHGGPPAVDMRLFNVKVFTLAGPIGGSPIAEGYDAAGTWGLVIVMAILAIVICSVSKPKTLDSVSVSRFAVVMLPVVVAVRNSFAPVVVQVSLGLAILYLSSLGARHSSSRSAPIESASLAG